MDVNVVRNRIVVYGRWRTCGCNPAGYTSVPSIPLRLSSSIVLVFHGSRLYYYSYDLFDWLGFDICLYTASDCQSQQSDCKSCVYESTECMWCELKEDHRYYKNPNYSPTGNETDDEKDQITGICMKGNMIGGDLPDYCEDFYYGQCYGTPFVTIIINILFILFIKSIIDYYIIDSLPILCLWLLLP